MNRLPTVLLVAALALVVVGLVLAIGRPGDLDDGGSETANGVMEPSDDATTTTIGTGDASVTSTTGGTTTSASAPDGTASDRTGDRTGDGGASTTAGPGPAVRGGSGLDGAGSSTASDVEDGLADTGGTSLLGAAAMLAAVALLLPRRQP